MSGANSFNIGANGAQITIFDSSVGRVTFNGQTSFSTKPRIKKLESEGIDGKTRFRSLPNGHEGTFEFDRQDASIDSYFAKLEAEFYAGNPPPVVVITQTISELDGSVTQFQYIDVALDLEDSGTFKGLDKINPKVGFRAGRKIAL